MYTIKNFPTEEEFRKIVSEAIDRLPEDFKAYLENVEIVVEDEPDSEQMQQIGEKYHGGKKIILLGLYEGVPINKKSVFSIPTLPARIVLFRKTIKDYCSNRKEMIEQIYRTLLHEIGHHFGLSDKRLRELGF